MTATNTLPAVPPRRRTAKSNEYVRSTDLADVIADWLGSNPSRSIAQLALDADVSSRAINKVLSPSTGGGPDRELETQTIYLADKLMSAMGRHVSELLAFRAPIRADDRRLFVQALNGQVAA